MVDVFSPARRSEIMSHIHRRGNKATELALVGLFRCHGIAGWRRHAKVFGSPDFIFTKCKVAIFADGCFWHGCPRHATLPKTNRAFWKEKLARNKVRDRLVTRTLRRHGWRVVRVWQHELSRNYEQHLLRRLRELHLT
jgi:DNA mismatch endonuclease (patch repair protein)